MRDFIWIMPIGQRNWSLNSMRMIRILQRGLDAATCVISATSNDRGGGS